MPQDYKYREAMEAAAQSETERIEEQRTDAIIAALKRKIGAEGRLYASLTTEQLLAMALNALVHHSKETLMLMEASKLLAARAVEEKKAKEN